MSPFMVPGWLISILHSSYLFSSYLITWLFHRSGNSLLVIAVFHGVVDLVSLTPASNTFTLVTVNAGLIAAAVAVVIRYAPALDRDPRRRRRRSVTGLRRPSQGRATR